MVYIESIHCCSIGCLILNLQPFCSSWRSRGGEEGRGGGEDGGSWAVELRTLDQITGGFAIENSTAGVDKVIKIVMSEKRESML